MKVSSPYLLIIFLILLAVPFIYAQVVTQTQVIDLSERARDFFVEATKGNIQGQETVNIFGRFSELAEVMEEDIQTQGGSLVFLQSPETLNITTESVNDTLLGPNATSVLISGLNENFTEITEIVNLSGPTGVNTIQEFIRVNRMIVNGVGNYSVSNAGIINAISSVTNNLQIQIPAEDGESQSSHYTVPAGKEIIISAISFSVQTDKSATIKFLVRENADDITPVVSPIRAVKEVVGINGVGEIRTTANLRFTEKTDLWFRGIGETGGISVQVSYDFVQYAIGT